MKFRTILSFIAVLALSSLALVSAQESGVEVIAAEEPAGEEPKIPVDVVILNEKNFEHLTQAATGATTGDWFVKFYAPWCGHCVKLAPVWAELAGEVGSSGVNVAKVDVTGSRSLGTRFEIKGFPTLLFFSRGKVYKYKGKRTLEALKEFATGGYKSETPVDVAEPKATFSFPTSVADFKKLGETIGKDLQGIPKRKMPSAVTVVLMAITGMTIFMVMLIKMLSAPEPPVAPKKKD